MQKNVFFLSFLLVYIACSLFLATTIHSADLKAQMAERLPAIEALKNKGVIGENNKGFLEFRTNDKSQAQLVQAENADRATVYQMIASKQGASAQLVGERRAIMIAEKGAAGQWYQKPDGSWYRK